MRSKMVSLGVFFLLVGVISVGCQKQQESRTTRQVQLPETMKQVAQEKAATAIEAIKHSEAMQSDRDKVNYLIGQANNFYNAKQFQPVIDVTQYILKSLDANSSPARSLFEKAEQGLWAAVNGVTEKPGTSGQ